MGMPALPGNKDRSLNRRVDIVVLSNQPERQGPADPKP